MTEENKLKEEILILVGRLYFEDWNTFSPETMTVMEKYAPEIEKLMNLPVKRGNNDR